MDGRLLFPAQPEIVRQLRADVRRIAAALGVAEEVGDKAALVVDELVNNAIEHGAVYRQNRSQMSLTLSLQGRRLAIEFVDPEMPAPIVDEVAGALADAANGLPSLESERGRGLFLLSIYLEGLRAGTASGGGLRLVGLLAE